MRPLALLLGLSLWLTACSQESQARDAGLLDGPDPKVHLVKPGESIQAAIDAARPGHEVRILPGTYSASAKAEAFLVVRPEKDGILIRGSGASPSEVVIDGKQQVLHVIFIDAGITRATRIENLTVTGGHAFPSEPVTPELRPEVASSDFYRDGAGVMVFQAAPTLRGLRVTANHAKLCGAGISSFCYEGDQKPCTAIGNGPLVVDCEITDNVVDEGTGGGIDAYFGSAVEIVNTLLSGNNGFGAIAILDGTRVTVTGSTVVANKGQGIGATGSGKGTVSESIIAMNSTGLQLEGGATVALSTTLFFSNDDGETPPAGGTYADPLFATGPRGDYYLSQTAAGQGADSPALDAGSSTAAERKMDTRTTRTDGAADSGKVDLGYHYPRWNSAPANSGKVDLAYHYPR